MKQLFARYKGYDRKTREVWGYASRPEIDRDNEVILAAAWKHPDSLRDFLKNPVLVAFHDYNQLPLGRVTQLEPRPDGLYFRAKFASTAAAKEAFQFILDTEGVAAFSVGFLPIEQQYISVKKLEKLGVDVKDYPSEEKIKTFTHVQLMEISLVPVPASAGSTALGNALRNGQIKTKALAAAFKDYEIEIEPEEEIVWDANARQAARKLTRDITRHVLAEYLHSPSGKAFIIQQVQEHIDTARGRVIEE